MLQRLDRSSAAHPGPAVRIAWRTEIADLPHWQSAFANERKDHRYYELVEDTLTDGFKFGYLIVEDDHAVRAIQPFFVVDQDLLAGMGAAIKQMLTRIRSLWPRFMRARTLMVGCAAGEGRLDGDDGTHLATADMFARFLPGLASNLNCALIVLKEFPVNYRTPLRRLMDAGFARVPSMPMTTLDIDYRNFEDYLSHCLSPRTRGKVRRKLRAAERARPTITVEVVTDATPYVDEIYPLYEKVFERSPLQFEKLTREFLREIGRRMPDKVGFSSGVRTAISSRSAYAPCRATASATNMLDSTMPSPSSSIFTIASFTTSSNGPSRTATNVSTAAASITTRNGTCVTRFTLSICTCATPPLRSTPCSDGCFR